MVCQILYFALNLVEIFGVEKLSGVTLGLGLGSGNGVLGVSWLVDMDTVLMSGRSSGLKFDWEELEDDDATSLFSDIVLRIFFPASFVCKKMKENSNYFIVI